ncbi:hypothetical protein [Sedimentitalea todarodis]|uniref:Zinc-finger domain-containing protein n=1 Tax=Sedimentitalea todarodis TaxID=1631240 RepID=A0ABU3VDV5_9RHOB|nr:hypothetical protein [Sedimentitalea todarodis]MDU9004365.1 hypothetical protein [Sedimentitalea todarodis]
MDQDDAILDYLQDRLKPEDRASFEADMGRDPVLAAEVDLMRQVRAELASGSKHDDAEAVWDRLSASMDEAPQAANENRRPWIQGLRYAAVGVIAVAAWQLAVVPRLDAPGDGFRTASELQSEAYTLQVKFIEGVTLEEIAELLGPLAGTISDGPSALGLVRLSFPDAASLAQAQETLNYRGDLVEFLSEE